MNKLSLFNEKTVLIDRHIKAAEYREAHVLIDEVLEWAPGEKIDEIPRSGKIYWYKVLANASCKNHNELLCKGKILQKSPAFKNAMKYADGKEREGYELVEKTEAKIAELLMSALVEKERSDKKSKLGNLPNEYKRKFDDAERKAQESINRLEGIERLICEQVIDCMTITKEYKKRLGDIYSEAKNKYKYMNEISEKEKNEWVAELDVILSNSNVELEKLKEVESSHPAFLEYKRLINERRNIISEVTMNISDDIYNLRQQAQNLETSIDGITKKYAGARKTIDNGSYAVAVSLLSQERFEEIVKQAIKQAIERR